MLKASSLLYATVIALIIALISSSLILYSYLNTLQIRKNIDEQRLVLNANSGLNILLSKDELIPFGEKKSIDLFETGLDSVQLERRSWGVFEIGICKSIIKNRSISSIILIGGFNSTENIAFYLADEGKPLSVCGNTEIIGTAYLPKAGVKRAYIEGQNFTGSQFVKGEAKQSFSQLPGLNTNLLKLIKERFASIGDKKDSIYYVGEKDIPDSIDNSFDKSTIVIYGKGPLNLSFQHYSGNVILISDKAVFISPEAILKDILILAPKVVFDKSFSGNIQVFATDSVIVKEKCLFNYPSVLSIIRSDKSVDNPCISIGEDSQVRGIILGYEEIDNPNKKIKVSLAKNTILTGFLYSNGIADLKGIIFGTAYVDKLILNTPSSVYENHLLNAIINRSKLPESFAGIELKDINYSKKIVKWLH
jgi:hypothetical protein